MTRRNTELLLLFVGTLIVALLYYMLGVVQAESLGYTLYVCPVLGVVAFLAAHVVLRKCAPNADPALLPIVYVLSNVGIVFIMRLAGSAALTQSIWLVLGVAAFIAVVVFAKDVNRFAEYPFVLALCTLLLFLSPLLPVVGHESYGSRIWLSFAGHTVQPGEFAKIAFVLFLAGYLAKNREMLSVFTWQLGPFRLPDARTILPLIIIWGFSFVIAALEKDLGSALLLFLIFLAMLFIATGKKFYLVVAGILAAVAGVLLYSLFGHVQVRVATWLDPFADAAGKGYQLTQTIYSLADGGLFGVGIGKGLSYLIPVATSDFIFAVISEETGLLGAAAILLLYLCFAMRGFVISSRAKNDVSAFIAAGLTVSIALQAFIIVGGVTRLIPLTGLTLPFMSQGGSSLVASFILLGLLVACSNQASESEAELQVTTKISSVNSNLGRYSLGQRFTGGMVMFSLMIAVLIGNLTWTMVVQAEDIQNMPSNGHTIANAARVQRGSISTSDGVILAQSVADEDGTYSRSYPMGSLAAHVVGYYSSTYGTSGIENVYNDELTGTRSFASWTDALAALTGAGTSGNDITLTINSRVQQAAEQALSGYSGACVVIDPRTGAILAMASSPTYNIEQVEEYFTGNNSNSALYNRATQALYAPGSTFKIVTLAGALEHNVASETSVYDASGTIEIGNGKVSNFNDTDYGEITLARATEVSSNTAYAQLGIDLGAQALVKTAEHFGFDKSFDFCLPVSQSIMASPSDMTEWELAWAAAGEPVGTKSASHQSEAGPQASVLQMALVGCAIANNGTIMKPYLVDSIYNAQGVRSFTAQASALYNAVSSSTASRVRDVLIGVVNNGTGYPAAVRGVQVAGKTGTAERSDGNDYWFVGMAPADNASVVVALVIEQGESNIAANRAKNVFQTALEVQGLL